jgi:hypothetical protein
MRVFCKCSAKIESKKFVSGVTILLSLTVFLNLVAETLPQVSDAIPLLGSKSYHYSSFCFELISYIFFVPRSFPHSVNVFHFTLGVLLVVGVFHFTFLSLSLVLCLLFLVRSFFSLSLTYFSSSTLRSGRGAGCIFHYCI